MAMVVDQERGSQSSVDPLWARLDTPGFAYFILLLVSVFYALWHIVASLTMSHGAVPLVFAFYRCLGATVLLSLVLAVLMPGESIFRVLSSGLSTKQWLRFVALATAQAANAGGFILAMSCVPLMTVSLCQPIVPVLAAVVSACCGIEGLTFFKLVAILISVVGAMVVVVGGHNLGESGTAEDGTLGVFFIGMNVTGAALYHCLVKSLVETYSPILVTAIGYSGASLWLFSAALIALGPRWLSLEVWTMGGDLPTFLGLAYAVVFASAGAYALLAWANRKTSPTAVTCCVPLQPLFAAILSCLFLGTHLSTEHVMGGALILFGFTLYISARMSEDELVRKPLLPPNSK